MLGGGDVRITDVKVNPASGNVFVSVARGTGAGTPALVKVTRDGTVSAVALKDIPFASVKLPNPTTTPGRRAARRVDHPTRVRGRQADRRRAVERRVRQHAARDPVPVQGTPTRAPASRSSTAPQQAGNARPDPHVRGVQGRQGRQHHGGLHLHAAGEDPGERTEARREGEGHDHRRTRQRQHPAGHGRLHEGRQGLPARDEHRPRRDEDPDGNLRDRRTPSPPSPRSPAA